MSVFFVCFGNVVFVVVKYLCFPGLKESQYLSKNAFVGLSRLVHDLAVMDALRQKLCTRSFVLETLYQKFNVG
jgi:hypothetical protein